MTFPSFVRPASRVGSRKKDDDGNGEKTSSVASLLLSRPFPLVPLLSLSLQTSTPQVPSSADDDTAAESFPFGDGTTLYISRRQSGSLPSVNTAVGFGQVCLGETNAIFYDGAVSGNVNSDGTASNDYDSSCDSGENDARYIVIDTRQENQVLEPNFLADSQAYGSEVVKERGRKMGEENGDGNSGGTVSHPKPLLVRVPCDVLASPLLLSLSSLGRAGRTRFRSRCRAARVMTSATLSLVAQGSSFGRDPFISSLGRFPVDSPRHTHLVSQSSCVLA